ncbi:MAG TPA: SpoIID/LytB domain-containing protein [Syntrophorhabdaceae bacterium]|jgi:peptidoglycan hydrolase-like amidase
MNFDREEEGVPERAQPVVAVGVMDLRREVSVRLNGEFTCEEGDGLSGAFTARTEGQAILITEGDGRETVRSSRIRLEGRPGSTFTLLNVTIGKNFHWERAEEQTFEGNLILLSRGSGVMAVINEIPIEEYLRSVISSEMKATAPMEFLKVHSILSRSWLLAALDRKQKKCGTSAKVSEGLQGAGEMVRWYEQEEHDLFDVCADDHCQRYQGVTKIVSPDAARAVKETEGKVIAFRGVICDARYSKACGGITETFRTAWEEKDVPYLIAVSDSEHVYPPIITEEEAHRWIISKPQAYCNVDDPAILAGILPDFDRETKEFFRWKTEYERDELEAIMKEKSGIDFGVLREIIPLRRGPSGRISRLKITGSGGSMIVGKELEIRRWLSPTHLFSSAFIVETIASPAGEIEKFIFHGAGWGHGVGLCQIGAAVMATTGFKAEEILSHYFPGTEVRKIY